DCQGTRVAADSICLGSYNMDSHNAQRVVQNGHVRNEGDVQMRVPRPYPISYRAIAPRRDECDNLLVTFALSASHTGFGSIRMEPVFMMISQSAATAAALAIDDHVSVQQVDYSKLAHQLQAGGQMLVWKDSLPR
ncbi:MAG TPA: FAD-dependent oxidoreductase, partial [Candidatus Acidoferrales bacterium]|nr:FAD-dependent oxidoreductase [Candidatus Acidoferrales bacterium]